MSDRAPRVQLRLPDGSMVEAGPDSLVGRSPACAVRIDDSRVSTVHAELSNREAGITLIARGGRLRVAGRGLREVLLLPGLSVDLAPGVSLEVEAVERGDAEVVPPTRGREELFFREREADLEVFRGGDDCPVAVLTGVSARIAQALLDAGAEGARWGDVAEAVWPHDGALRRRLRECGRVGPDDWTDTDEQRLRNRWDQALRLVRRALEPVGSAAVVESEGGLMRLRVGQR